MVSGVVVAVKSLPVVKDSLHPLMIELSSIIKTRDLVGISEPSPPRILKALSQLATIDVASHLDYDHSSSNMKSKRLSGIPQAQFGLPCNVYSDSPMKASRSAHTRSQSPARRDQGRGRFE